jgi:predicted ArsR family transcriptional regulator
MLLAMARFKVTSVEQVQALTSPLRSEIVRLCQEHPRSVAELATALSRSAAALHYHVRHLEAIGLLRQTGKRSIGPRSERVYEAVSKELNFSGVDESPAYREALRKKTRSVIRRMSREYEAAWVAERRVALSRSEGYLTAANLERARDLLREVHDLLSSGTPGDGHRFSFTGLIVGLPHETEKP